jgi:hypothetical protein
MPITGWIAILVLIVMCYMLIKQYETRMCCSGAVSFSAAFPSPRWQA